MPIINGVQRRYNSLRLRTLDYRTQGGYFVTIRVRNTSVALSTITANSHDLSAAGMIILSEAERLPLRYSGTRIEAPMIMPDHVHLIVWVDAPDAPSVSIVIGGLKSVTARRINTELGLKSSFWQSGFFDRYIRDERELEEVREYIRLNPERWRTKHGLI